MKPWTVLAGLLLCTAAAADSFRFGNGRIVTDGMSRAEVLVRIGPPLSRETLSIGINNVESRELWLYRTEGAVAGEYLVTIIVQGDRVVEIRSEPIR